MQITAAFSHHDVPHVYEVEPMKREAIRELADRKAKGKVVVTVGDG